MMEVKQPHIVDIVVEIQGTPELTKKMMYAIREFAEKLDVKVKILGGKDENNKNVLD